MYAIIFPSSWHIVLRYSNLLLPDLALFEVRHFLSSLPSQHLTWCLTHGRFSGRIGLKNEWFLGSRTLRRVATWLWVLRFQYYIYDPKLPCLLQRVLLGWTVVQEFIIICGQRSCEYQWCRYVSMCLLCMCVCVCECECVWERERQRENASSLW